MEDGDAWGNNVSAEDAARGGPAIRKGNGMRVNGNFEAAGFADLQIFSFSNNTYVPK